MYETNLCDIIEKFRCIKETLFILHVVPSITYSVVLCTYCVSYIRYAPKGIKEMIFGWTYFKILFQELFGDVGGMIESRLVRPGTAEVIYKTLEDAQRAVELYHKRQLDGQPMNCLLVTPRSNAAPQR